MAEQGQNPLKFRADARPKRPENFLAAANGTTDDRAAMIEWAAAGGAGVVLELKPGATYRVASRGPLTFAAGSIVKGNGATILLDYTDTSNNAQITTGVGTKINNLNIQWSGAGYAERGISVGEDAEWVGGTIEAVTEQPDTAVDESSDATVTFTGANARLSGVTFRNIWKPIRVNAADGKIKECDFYLFGKGIAIEAAATALVVEANRFHSLSSYGTQAPGEGPLTGAANGLTVRGNTIFAASEHGLYVSGDTLAVDVVIDSNTVFASGQSNYKTRNCDVRFIGNSAQDAAFGNSTGTTEDAAAFEDCPNVFVNGFTAAGRSKSNAGNYALRFDSCAKMAVSGVVTERAQESVILITDDRIRAALGGYEHVSTLINGLTVQDPGAGRLMDIVFAGNCGTVEVLNASFSGGSGTVMTTDIAGTAGKIMLQGNIDTTGTMHNNIAGGDDATFPGIEVISLAVTNTATLAAALTSIQAKMRLSQAVEYIVTLAAGTYTPTARINFDDWNMGTNSLTITGPVIAGVPTAIISGAGLSGASWLRKLAEEAPNVRLELNYLKFTLFASNKPIDIRYGGGALTTKNLHSDSAAGLLLGRGLEVVVRGSNPASVIEGNTEKAIIIQDSYYEVGDASALDGTGAISFTGTGEAVSPSRGSKGYVRSCTFNGPSIPINLEKLTRCRTQSCAFTAYTDVAVLKDSTCIWDIDGSNPNTYAGAAAATPVLREYDGTQDSLDGPVRRIHRSYSGPFLTIPHASGVAQDITEAATGGSEDVGPRLPAWFWFSPTARIRITYLVRVSATNSVTLSVKIGASSLATAVLDNSASGSVRDFLVNIDIWGPDSSSGTVRYMSSVQGSGYTPSMTISSNSVLTVFGVRSGSDTVLDWIVEATQTNVTTGALEVRMFECEVTW